jgi:hypothetical protein
VGIAENLTSIREHIRAAARRAGRNPDETMLLAVSKTFPAEAIIEAYEAGQRLFGENRVQEFEEKAPKLTQLHGAEFRMIGHLQSNKASRAVELFAGVDSLDSVKLAQRLNAAAEAMRKTLDVLIEINLGGEESKSGVAPDSPELESILTHAPQWSHLRIRGLMTVPPYTDDPEGARPYFQRLRQLRDGLVAQNPSAGELRQLSMGMSHDFEVAIEEGSTCVRIGTAIFGKRPKP